MTEVSEAAKAKACELLNAAVGSGAAWKPEFIDPSYNKVGPAFARFIQDVSDAVAEYYGRAAAPLKLAPFILPDPVDPLEEEAHTLAMGHTVWETDADMEAAEGLALAALKRGMELASEGVRHNV